MGFWRHISPKRAVGDFADHWRQPTPHRWPILGLAMAITFAVLFLTLPDSERLPPAMPQITYITSFAPDRTRADIIASNLANQRRKDARAVELAKREEARKEAFRQLGRATFVDVDAMEADIKRRQAAEDAAAATAAARNPPVRSPTVRNPAAGITQPGGAGTPRGQ